eukprot:GHVT01062974.1.p1 GENE.GHVT01062974.1~~GHVT01062974.1.p1  ORF type:complete len:120 (+),score=16.99 GHVT01062974.1:47-406(+)
MDFSEPRPRINGSMLAGHQGKGVVVLGMAQTPAADGMSFKIMTSDKQEINVKLQEPLQEYVEGLVEIHGVVDNFNNLQCHSYVFFTPEQSKNFDLDAYDKAVQFTNQFKEHYLQGQPAA